MGNVAHTPGPWNAERMLITKATKDRRSGFVVNGPLPEDALQFPVRICDLRVPAGMDGSAEGEANARLIAAAPDMLAALRLIFNDAENGYDTILTFKGHDAVRDAIAKAEGGGA